MEREIAEFLVSPKRQDMITGENYYRGKQDILFRKRKVIGEGGELKEVKNLPNNRLVDNQFCKLVEQKAGYSFGKPLAFSCDDEEMTEDLKKVIDRRFLRLLKHVAEDATLGGIGYIYFYIDGSGKPAFRRFKPYEILPFWADEDHTELELAVRIYSLYGYEGNAPERTDKAEVYTPDGVVYYELKSGKLIPDSQREISDGYIPTEYGNAEPCKRTGADNGCNGRKRRGGKL
ncbi:MAG: phage portal protein [Eubacterium sp.]|nr:phage portal protein [Eubacterium sp.]